jgi:hypothetical protein
MKLLLVGLAIASTLLFPSAVEAKWVEVGASDETTLEIDDSTIRSAGNIRWYWMRLRHTNPIDGTRTRIDSYQSANCLTGQTRARQVKVFNSRGRLISGEALGDYAPLVTVEPGTLDETALAIACSWNP